MKMRREIPPRVLRFLQGTVGIVSLTSALFLFLKPAPSSIAIVAGVIFGLVFALLAGILLAPLISESLAGKATGILWGGEKLKTPPPTYSRAESLRIRGSFEEAIDELSHVAEAYPEEVRPWIDSLNILIENLGDIERAQRFMKEVEQRAGSEQILEQVKAHLERLLSLHAERDKKEAHHIKLFNDLKTYQWDDNESD